LIDTHAESALFDAFLQLVALLQKYLRRKLAIFRGDVFKKMANLRRRFELFSQNFAPLFTPGGRAEDLSRRKTIKSSHCWRKHYDGDFS
jgi:hypothetical protein